MITTFNYYKHLKKEAVKTLMQYNLTARESYQKVRNQMPYLFAGKKFCDQYDLEKR